MTGFRRENKFDKYHHSFRSPANIAGKSALALAVEMQSAGVVRRLLDARPSLKSVDYDAIMAAGKRRGDVEVLSAIEQAMGNKQLPQR